MTRLIALPVARDDFLKPDQFGFSDRTSYSFGEYDGCYRTNAAYLTIATSRTAVCFQVIVVSIICLLPTLGDQKIRRLH